MTVPWLALILTILLNSAANVLIKAGVLQLGPTGGPQAPSGSVAIPLLALAAALILNAAANVLIKGASTRLRAAKGPLLARAAKEPRLTLGLLLFGLNVACYAYALRQIQLSVAYPIMTSLGFVIVGSCSALLFREAIRWVHGAGYILIVAGVWLVASGATVAGGGGASPPLWSLILSALAEPRLLAGLVCFALAMGSYTLALGQLNLSIAYPIMTSTSFALVGLASFWLFDELIVLHQILGYGLIIGGVVVVARAP